MIYFDNAATTRFKPSGVIKALVKEVKNSSNSGRSGHDDAIANMAKIEYTRRNLLKLYGAESGYNIVFTKNCTEALNLAISGFLKGNEKAVTTVNEHNSMLRPLFEKKRNGLSLTILNPTDNLSVSSKHVLRAAYDADFIGLNLASNVTGAVCDVADVGQKKSDRTVLLVDGSQGSPYIDINMTRDKIDMLAMPAHKGLHGIQGVGFLIFREDIKLKPLLFGGTGVASDSVYQPLIVPECYEAGTLFAAGIHALNEGAVWSFKERQKNAEKTKMLTTQMYNGLVFLGLKVYCVTPRIGIVSFKHNDIPPSVMADELNDCGFAVRSGLHCAPLIHNHLGTLDGGLIRASIGVDNTMQEVNAFLNCLEKIVARKNKLTVKK
ncbi:MAG: aminotransferase class V-fold PLP-dependent enzyme [Acidaminococcus sp.]|nr:aminotransferase class V-fold PLP-dependent enzyme [Acidaminococcus sp.]